MKLNKLVSYLAFSNCRLVWKNHGPAVDTMVLSAMM